MERLQKVIAHAGICSRRKAEELIVNGQVTVNGQVVKELGTKVSRKDEIMVNGSQIQREDRVYYLLNKPESTITATEDNKGRKTVIDCFGREVEERIYPIGRLDYDTTGVLLLTNDGDFVNFLLRPEHHVEKEYRVKVKGLVRKPLLRKIESGVVIEGGYKTKKSRVESSTYNKKTDSTYVNLVITEGKYHQVKLMFEAIGHKVTKLKRVRFGNIVLDGLPKGAYRELKPHELKVLKHLATSKNNN